MFTTGYKIYRHKGWYFNTCKSSFADPARFGVTILDEIPLATQTPESFGSWIKDKRQYCDRLLADPATTRVVIPEGGPSDWESLMDALSLPDFFVSRARPKPNDEEWIYEVDLDRLVFHVNGAPMYRLNHMPPKDLFLAGISYNIYGQHACHKDVPVEYRFAPDALPTQPPPVDNATLEKYQRMVVFGSAPCALDSMLSTTGYAAPAPVLEETTVAERTVYFHRFMKEWNTYIVEEFTCLPDAAALSPLGRCLAFNLAALALLPVAAWSNNTVQERRLARSTHVWWPRRHICVLLATHLTDADTRKAAIVHLVEEITSKDVTFDAPAVVYGVVFSVFHCVLVRIDLTTDYDKLGGEHGEHITHTDVLPFCPDILTSAPEPGPEQRTPLGLAALARLGTLPAADDEDFFYTLLCPDLPAAASDDANVDTPQALPTPTGAQRLPQELLDRIALLIVDRAALVAFALAARCTMAAVLPRLRFPSVVLNRGRNREDARGVVLERSLPAYTHAVTLTEAVFGARYGDERVVVVFCDDLESPPELPDTRARQIQRLKGKELRVGWGRWSMGYVFTPPSSLVKLDDPEYKDFVP